MRRAPYARRDQKEDKDDSDEGEGEEKTAAAAAAARGAAGHERQEGTPRSSNIKIWAWTCCPTTRGAQHSNLEALLGRRRRGAVKRYLRVG